MVVYGDDPNQVFGGPWGDSARYQWRENIASPEQQKNDQIAQLNAEYEKYMNELAVNYAKALAQGNTVGAANISAEMADVKTQYQINLDTIQDQ